MPSLGEISRLKLILRTENTFFADETILRKIRLATDFYGLCPRVEFDIPEE